MKVRKVVYLAAGVFAVAGCLLLAGPAGASRQIRATLNVACGDTLHQSTTLNGDLDCSTHAGTAVTIDTPGITFDLGGHTITGDTADNEDVVVADDTCISQDGNCDNVTVTNGTIDGGYDQVDFWGNSDTASNLTLKNAGDIGVYLDYTTSALIQNNTISGSGDEGIYGGYDAGDQIYGNVLDSNAYGIYFDYAAANIVQSNYTRGTTYYGYYDDDSQYNVFSGNVSTYDATNGGSYAGMYLDEDECGNVTATSNTVRLSQGDEGFYSYYNYGSAYYCEEGYSAQPPYSSFSGNVAYKNAGYGFYDESSYNATWDSNKALSNGSYGFYFYNPGFETITNNTSNANSDSGFYVEENYSYYSGQPAAFANNTAMYNSNYGFEAPDAALPGSNNAGGNSNSAGDCYEVAGCS